VAEFQSGAWLYSAKYLMDNAAGCMLPSSTVSERRVSALTRLLFPAPAEVRSTASIFRWWESRRLTFNVIVGAAGLVTLAATNLIALLPPLSMHMGVFLPGIVLYGFLANVFYSLGFVTEAAMQRAWHDETPRVGPALFRQGLIFSVGLTLFPIALMGIGWSVQVLKWILR
jgi:hypothetical protein